MRAKVTRGAGFLACQQPGRAWRLLSLVIYHQAVGADTGGRF